MNVDCRYIYVTTPVINHPDRQPKWFVCEYKIHACIYVYIWITLSCHPHLFGVYPHPTDPVSQYPLFSKPTPKKFLSQTFNWLWRYLDTQGVGRIFRHTHLSTNLYSTIIHLISYPSFIILSFSWNSWSSPFIIILDLFLFSQYFLCYLSPFLIN